MYVDTTERHNQNKLLRHWLHVQESFSGTLHILSSDVVQQKEESTLDTFVELSVTRTNNVKQRLAHNIFDF